MTTQTVRECERYRFKCSSAQEQMGGQYGSEDGAAERVATSGHVAREPRVSTRAQTTPCADLVPGGNLVGAHCTAEGTVMPNLPKATTRKQREHVPRGGLGIYRDRNVNEAWERSPRLRSCAQQRMVAQGMWRRVDSGSRAAGMHPHADTPCADLAARLIWRGCQNKTTCGNSQKKNWPRRLSRDGVPTVLLCYHWLAIDGTA